MEWGNSELKISFDNRITKYEDFTRSMKEQCTTEAEAPLARATVSMPQDMKDRAMQRMRGEYSTFSDYVKDLIRRDLKVRATERQEEAKAA